MDIGSPILPSPMKATVAIAALYHALIWAGCSGARQAPPPDVAGGDAGIAGGSGNDAGSGGGSGPADGADGGVHGWAIAYKEDFQQTAVPEAAWAPDPFPDDGPYSDDGAYFRGRGVVPPAGFRISAPLGTDGWLRIESYTRSSATPFHDLASVTGDPADPANRVLRIASPAHTDGTVIRPA